jgi:hypothetical protein
MKQTLVRYRTKPEAAQENERLIAAVFEELRRRSPDGLRYLALRLADGSFIHISIAEDGASPVSALDAFRTFRSGVEARCLEPPQFAEATIVGSYRMLGGPADA